MLIHVAAVFVLFSVFFLFHSIMNSYNKDLNS